jgi:hypothetical protein
VLLKWVNIVFTFTLVCIAYIFFRANTLSDAFYILVHAAAGIPQLRPSSIAEFDNYMHNDFVLACLGIGIVMLNDYAAVNNFKLVKDLWEKRWVRRSFDFAVTAGIVLFGAFYGGRQTFIYFEF